MKIAVVKYNAGNVQSVIYALQRLGVEPLHTDDHHEITTADKVIFPGQGEASSAMTYLRDKGLDKVLTSLTQPFLGICIGLQLMCRHSEEGDTDCLGIFDLGVKKFEKGIEGYKVPHMGWNIQVCNQSKLFTGLTNPYLYYVHSYYAALGPETIGTTDYIVPFSGALHKDNYYAVQAHPEKSSTPGQIILTNFLAL
ncbi:MAG: imidazole glycerol phosphate synthase subunit HisH [Cyclobacteriaceae bacterium]|nr:MAG: imidazole glycerol phosphate synthase subunit HisH [Cyclobacteriaceae bacterium]